jgi:subtilisin
LHFGKDIGSEINADVFWIGASLKRQRFEAAMGVVVRVQNLVSGRIEEHSLAVRGHGFYFQLSGVYLGYEAALALAKRNAMTQAFDRLTTAMAERVIGLLARAPLRARASVWQGAVYLPLGLWNRKMIVGEKFYNKSSYIRGGGAGLFEVDQVYERVCRLRVVGAGVGPAVETGDEFISLAPGEMPPATDDANKIGVGAASSFAPASIVTGSSAHSPSTTVFNLGDLDPDIRSAGFIEEAARRFLKGLEALITLPARLARFLQYDQGFRGVGGSRPLDERAIRHRAENDWALTQLGLPAAWAGGLGAPHVKVAVLDTGVDYNLDELRRSMAVIRHPVFGDGAGYDFFGGDNRAYDDHAHGTAAASLVLDVAPGIKIIPIKVFSSWGETTSAALYAGFDYALRAGARVILVPWGTEVNSVALKVGVERAARAGALVVTTSGDLGPGQGQVAVRYPAAFAKEDQNVRDSMLVGVGLDKQGQPLLQAGPLKLTSARADTIDFGAPAHGVQALKPRGGLGRNNRGSVYYNGAAAAYGAGVAALVWSNYPGLTAAEVRQAVLHGLAPGASGSYPRLRADGALEGAKRVAKR